MVKEDGDHVAYLLIYMARVTDSGLVSATLDWGTVFRMVLSDDQSSGPGPVRSDSGGEWDVIRFTLCFIGSLPFPQSG